MTPARHAASPRVAALRLLVTREICESAAMSMPPCDRHRRWGWASLAAFALLGLLLETAHGFKWAPLVDHETRRAMWRLAHAHGALLGLVHLAFARELEHREVPDLAVSRALVVATLLMPSGFLLGGAWFYEGDPGLGISLVPIGAVALIYACARLASAPTSGTRG
jgi:hypothetical protein